MKKAMLSQPMAGKSDVEIVSTRERAINVLQSKGYEVVNTLFTDEWYNSQNMKERGVIQIPLCFLAKSLENMSLCHAAYFCKGWEKTRGCKIEHDAAVAYGLEIIYEEDTMSKYIGVKLIEAEPMTSAELAKQENRLWCHEQEFMEGYKVVYPDGYVSWSPKDTFEQAYMKIKPNPKLRTEGPSISEEMVDAFIKETHISTIGDKTTLVRCTLVNGFELVEASSCVDPANYDEELGAKVCMGKIKGQVWYLLGFLLQCGVGGVNVR